MGPASGGDHWLKERYDLQFLGPSRQSYANTGLQLIVAGGRIPYGVSVVFCCPLIACLIDSMTYSGVQIVNLGTPWESQPALHYTPGTIGLHHGQVRIARHGRSSSRQYAIATRRGRCTVPHETFRDTCMKARFLEVGQLSHYSGPAPGSEGRQCMRLTRGAFSTKPASSRCCNYPLRGTG